MKMRGNSKKEENKTNNHIPTPTTTPQTNKHTHIQTFTHTNTPACSESMQHLWLNNNLYTKRKNVEEKERESGKRIEENRRKIIQ